MPERCTKCGSVSVARHGAGTERLEHDLAQVGHEVFRLDADVRDAGALLRRFEQAPRGILLGTQMVAKGHDFPDVTLGVVVDADGTLRFPDFRAEERTFALVAQLAGRAGRGPGGGPRASCRRWRRAPPRSPRPRATTPTASSTASSRAARRCAIRRSRTSSGSSARRPTRTRSLDAATAVRAALGEIPGATVLGPAPLFRLRGRERAQLVIKGDAAGRARCARRAPP